MQGGCEVLDGEMKDEKWEENGNKNGADWDDIHNLIKWGGVNIKCYNE